VPGTQRKPGGKAPRDFERRARLNAKPITTRMRATQQACEGTQSSNQANAVVATGATTATAICQARAGSPPVRRGMKVKRKPVAKQVISPWIWVMAWKVERYSSV